MLFTRHNLFEDSIANRRITGRASIFGICIPGQKNSVIETRDYFDTVNTAAHELGHSFGLDHDSEGLSRDCPAKDLFIMAPDTPTFDPDEPYTRNPWQFSSCSVGLFKKAFNVRHCLSNPGGFYSMEEWKHFTAKQPGQAYSYNEQCQHINGRNSVVCGEVNANICLRLRCTDPTKGTCFHTPFSVARGTTCGTFMVYKGPVYMWCKEGLCVAQR